ncbi:replication protein A 70 kDa DNA-binding subunit D-like [Phaseolus vulgaris]|uniref:replication protein A 70 kDa DNA-binding subunit D-like n=1 Tax=Phaseolus vulgaris TaxID=3885 RepID=UPI0035CACD51
MSSLSPENQLSNLPPDLTALVFTLFDVGGVDSMTAEKGAKRIHTRRAKVVARDGSIIMSKLQVHNQIHSVINVTLAKDNWSIIVRVICLWFVTDLAKSKIPFSMELILQDKEGLRIHGLIRRTLIYKFQSQIFYGSVYYVQSFSVAANGGSYRTTHHLYKISFLFGIKIISIPAQLVPESPPEYIPLSFISAPGFDTNYLVDIIGVLTGVRTERELQKDGRKTKLNVISLDFRIECTLFGNYVDELNVFLSSGEVQNVVVSIEFAKVKVFKIRFMPKTALIVPRMCSSSESPSQGLNQLSEASKHSLEDEFLHLTPRNTIEGLKECREAVYSDSKMFFCGKCNKHVMKVSLRYKIKLRVVDETDSTTFILFDREANSLLSNSCAEIFESHDKTDNLPKEFVDLLDKSFVFKVDSRNDQDIRFEQSFRVNMDLYVQNGKHFKGKNPLSDGTCVKITEGRQES